MNKKIALISGANSGIGKQAALQLMRKGCHVILACRSSERGKAALANMLKESSGYSGEFMQVDMSLQSSVRGFASEIKRKYPKIDILIHNAAIFNVTQKAQEKTEEGIETVWATNHLGPVLLTSLLLDELRKSPDGRIITIASKGLLAMPGLKINFDDPEFNQRKFRIVKAYYQSKLAQIMYTLYLSGQLANTKLTANCIRVPAVQIDVSRHPDLSPFMKWVYSIKSKKSITPAKAAETYTRLALDDEFKGISGKYFDEHCKQVSTGKYAEKKDNIDMLMKSTASYLKGVPVHA